MAVAPPVSYTIMQTIKQPGFGGQWSSPDRVHADVLRIEHFCHDSAFTPVTELKMLYDDEHLYGVFRVQDQFVLCRETEYQADVTRDASVSAYFQPVPNRGYLALDINCCGTLRAHFIEEPGQGRDAGPVKIMALPWKYGHQIRVYTSQFGQVDPEYSAPMTWYVEFVLPFTVFEDFVGSIAPVTQQSWRANFYKSAAACSHPHRASWAPLSGGVSFHQPECFASLDFA